MPDTLEAKVFEKLDALEKKFAVKADFELLRDEQKKSVEELKHEANEVRAKLNEIEKVNRNVRTGRPARPGEVSFDCANYIGAIAMAGGIRRGAIKNGECEKFVLDVIGKTALSSTDIPLPTLYGSEVSELVGMWGAARRWCTVYPLGAGVVSLPALKTDTTFTLLTSGSAITEKSPQTEWKTFTPEKFGGLVVVPSEIDADSAFALGQFLARYCARNIARVEDWNVFASTAAGSSVNGSAAGLKKLCVDNSNTAASGTLGSPSEFTLTHVRSIRKIVETSALANGAYYAHPTMEAQFASFNSAGDKPYQNNGLNGGPTLDGFPIRWVDALPVLTSSDAVSTVHILFGDLSFSYLGVRGGPQIDVNADAGFASDVIYVRGMERFTHQLMAADAVSGLITHSS